MVLSTTNTRAHSPTHTFDDTLHMMIGIGCRPAEWACASCHPILLMTQGLSSGRLTVFTGHSLKRTVCVDVSLCHEIDTARLISTESTEPHVACVPHFNHIYVPTTDVIPRNKRNQQRNRLPQTSAKGPPQNLSVFSSFVNIPRSRQLTHTVESSERTNLRARALRCLV